MKERELVIILLLIIGAISAAHFWGSDLIGELHQSYLGVREVRSTFAQCPKKYGKYEIDYCYFEVRVDRKDPTASKYLGYNWSVNGIWRPRCYLIVAGRPTIRRKIFPGDGVIVYGSPRCKGGVNWADYEVKIKFILYGHKEEEYGTATVSCTVKEKYTRRPIAGATCEWTFYPGGKVKSCITNREGYCRLPGAYSFKYAIVKAMKSGYETASERINGLPPGHGGGIRTYLYLRKLCRPGWTNEYRCRDNSVYRKYIKCVNGQEVHEWRKIKDCDELSGSWRECRGNDVVEVIKRCECMITKGGVADCVCTQDEHVIETCEYGCEDGRCVTPPIPAPTFPVELLINIIRELIQWLLRLIGIPS